MSCASLAKQLLLDFSLAGLRLFFAEFNESYGSVNTATVADVVQLWQEVHFGAVLRGYGKFVQAVVSMGIGQ